MKTGLLWDCEGREVTRDEIVAYGLKKPWVFHLYANEPELRRLKDAGCTNIAVLHPLYDPYKAQMSERAVRDYAIQMCRITDGVCVDFESWIADNYPQVIRWVYEECKTMGKRCLVAPKISIPWEKVVNPKTGKQQYRFLMTGVAANDKARAQFISKYSDYIVTWIYGYNAGRYVEDLLRWISLGTNYKKLIPMGDTGYRYGTNGYVSPATAANNVKTMARYGPWCMFMPRKSATGPAMKQMKASFGL